ncbi:hypothetical protein [Vibrio sp. AND4]|uniref:hypothetical protein n=1 Tax=Vibrio sp. AND4 TaxID=314289 RepID=UPI00015F350F|nr:hypothetical protein [Vibrio sp. AND4]EDP59630.1 hypothetical protein AND4_10749 [Vibrio sp. AND4]
MSNVIVHTDKNTAHQVGLATAKHYRSLNVEHERGAFAVLTMVNAIVGAGISLYRGGRNVWSNEKLVKDVTLKINNQTSQYFSVYALDQCDNGACDAAVIKPGQTAELDLGEGMGPIGTQSSVRVWFSYGTNENTTHSGILHFSDQSTSGHSRQVRLAAIQIPYNGSFVACSHQNHSNLDLKTSYFEVTKSHAPFYAYCPPIAHSQGASLTLNFVDKLQN